MKKLCSLLLTIAVILTSLASVTVFAETTVTTITVLAKSDTAATIAFDKGGSTYYTESDYALTLTDTATGTPYTDFNLKKYWQTQNSGKYKRIMTVTGLQPATTYNAELTVGESKLTGTITTADPTTVSTNVALGASVSVPTIDNKTSGNLTSQYSVEQLTTGTSVGAVYGGRDLWIYDSSAGTITKEKATVTVDLGRKVRVSKAEVYQPYSQETGSLSNTSFGVTDYNLSASADGKTWTAIATNATVGSNIAYTTHDFDAAEYQYFKLEPNAWGSSDLRLADIRIYNDVASTEEEIVYESAPVIAEAKSDTAVTIGFDKSPAAQTYYKDYEVTLTPKDGSAFTVSESNLVKYHQDTSTYKRMMTIKGLEPATEYTVSLKATCTDDTFKYYMGTFTTNAQNGENNLALGAKVETTSGNLDTSPTSSIRNLTSGTSLGAGPYSESRDLWIWRGTYSSATTPSEVDITVTLDTPSKVTKVRVYQPLSQGLTNAAYAATKYDLYASVNGTEWDLIGNDVTVGTDDTYTETSVVSEKVYKYFKIDVLEGGTSGIRIADFQVYNETVPTIDAVINNLQVVAKSDTAMSVAFNPDIFTACTKFLVMVDGELNKTVTYSSAATADNVITVTGLEPVTQYEIKLIGENDEGRTTPATVTATTLGSREENAVNVALGAEATNNGTKTSYGNNLLTDGCCGKILGGRNNQLYVTSANTSVQCVIDLGEVVSNIAHIEIYPYASYGGSVDNSLNTDSYKVEGSSDGNEYTEIGTVDNDFKAIVLTVNNASYRYIRLTLTETTPNASSGKYEYRLGDVKVYTAGTRGNFTVNEPTIEVGTKTVTANVSYENNNGSGMVLLLALYNNGNLVNLKTANVNIGLYDAVLSVSTDITNIEYTDAKAFVFRDLTSIIPLASSANVSK